MPASFSKSGPGLKDLAKQIKRLQKADVLVGIPSDGNSRKSAPINNAQLLHILSEGSPLQGIPATPILEPSIEINKDLIAPHLQKAAQSMLANNPKLAETELNLAGIVAANGAKRYFTEGNNWPPNRPATIARKGSDRRNIDTGQLRRAITSVVQIDGETASRKPENAQ